MRIISIARPAKLPPKTARYVWVQWADEPQPRKEGLPDHVRNTRIKRFLEEQSGRRLSWWQDAGGCEEEYEPQVTFS